MKAKSFAGLSAGFFSGLLVFAVPTVVSAAAGITYHGRLLRPDGSPVAASSVQFKIQIRTPGAENCLLYEEQQTKDLSESKGVFAIAINDGTATVINTEPFTIDRAFQNRGTFTFLPGKCAGAGMYTPNLTDGRRLVVEFNDGSFAGFEQMPAQNINYVPMAIETMTVGGFNASSLLRVVDGSGTPAAVSPLTPAQHNTLLDLANGTGSIGGNAVGFTGSLSGDVTGSQGATVVTRIQGRAVDTAAPTNGQALVWSTANSRWEPGTVSGGGGGDWSTLANKPTSFPPSAHTHSVADITSGAGSYLTYQPNGAACSAGEVLKWETAGGGRWICGVDSTGGGGGAVNSVTGTSPVTVNNTDAANPVVSVDASVTSTNNSLVQRDGAGAIQSAGANFGSLQVNNGTSTITLGTPAAFTSYVLKLPSGTGTNGQILTSNGTDMVWTTPTADATKVNKSGDTMTGALNLPVDGLSVGTDQLVVAGGNVGVGTTVPSGLFSVGTASQLRINSNGIIQGPDGTASAPTYSFTSDSRVGMGYLSGGVSFTAYGSSMAQITSSGGISVPQGVGYSFFADSGTGMFRTGTQSLGFKTSSSERLRIDSLGNVGVGTTTSTERMTVNGNVQLAGTGKLLFPAGTALGEYYGWNVTLTDHAGGQAFRVLADNDGTSGPVISAKSNHLVGVNTDAPASALSVNGNLSLGSYAGTAAPTNGMIVSGNVGIGTATPENKLHITTSAVGDPALASKYTSAFVLSPASVNVIFEMDWNSTNAYYLQSKHKVSALGMPLVLNPSGGNVGVNTGSATPLASLHVLSSAAPAAVIERSGPSNISTQYKGTAGSVFVGQSGNGHFAVATGNEMTSTNLLTILATGNAGIGTTNPAAKLDVNGTIRPGTFTTGAACSPQGAVGYDSATSKLVVCDNSAVWVAVGGGSSTPPAGTLCGARAAECTAATTIAYDDGGGWNVQCQGSTLTASCVAGYIANPTGCPAGYTAVAVFTSNNIGRVYNLYCRAN